MSHVEMVVRITAAAVLGGIMGYERHRYRRPIGLRPHLIVTMASATFMVISSQFVCLQHFGKDDLVEVDASRIAASIVSAVGFLAGGAIVRTGATVQGLTTAAGLWLVTAIGMCAGAGMYVEGVAATVLDVIALTGLRRFENNDDHLLRRRVSVVLGEELQTSPPCLRPSRAWGAVLSDVEYKKRLDDDKKRILRPSGAFDESWSSTMSENRASPTGVPAGIARGCGPNNRRHDNGALMLRAGRAHRQGPRRADRDVREAGEGGRVDRLHYVVSVQKITAQHRASLGRRAGWDPFPAKKRTAAKFLTPPPDRGRK